MQEDLEQFYREAAFIGKGPLSVAIQLTESAKHMAFPLNPKDFLTERGGQVKGLGGPNLKKILKTYNIDRILSSEGGRTSRGSIDNMEAYFSFLNSQYAKGVPINWDLVGKFWAKKVQEYFDASPFSISVDSAQSIRTLILNLLQQALDRQRQIPGSRFQGIMMQHLIGAKLEMVMPPNSVTHNSVNTNDQERGRTGDFDLGDVSIHVTTRPSEALLEKCSQNLHANRKPLIITLDSGVNMAIQLADELGIVDRVEIIDFVQFVVTNIHERSSFARDDRYTQIERLVENYNRIVDSYETDPSLRIEIALGR